MRSFSKTVLTFVVLLTVAAAASAAEPATFIAIADPATGRVLVPEGTVVPPGVRFYVRPITEQMLEEGSEAPADPGQPLVFAYAADSEFAEARRVIALERDATIEGEPRFFAAARDEMSSTRRTTADRTKIGADASEYIYLYFEEGSYLRAYRTAGSYGADKTYGVATYLSCAPGTYTKATLRPKQSSNLVWAGTDPFAVSRTCYVYSTSGGTCGTPTYGVQTSNPSFSAVVTSEGSILQRFYRCDVQNYDPTDPCIVGYSGTIEIRFP